MKNEQIHKPSRRKRTNSYVTEMVIYHFIKLVDKIFKRDLNTLVWMKSEQMHKPSRRKRTNSYVTERGFVFVKLFAKITRLTAVFGNQIAIIRSVDIFECR